MTYGYPLQTRRPIRHFTDDEDVELTCRRIAGESLKAIAQHLQRRKSSIQMRLATLAKRDEADQ
jgi:hypothetical protein